MNLASAFQFSDRLAARLLDPLRDPLLLLVRICWGWQFFLTGKGKLANLDRTTDFFAGLGIPLPGLNAAFVGSLECVGGLLLLVGLLSRPIALALAGSMVVAFVTADREALLGVFSDLQGFVSAAPFPFLLASLLVVAFGPGRFALDTLIMRRAPERGAQRASLRTELGS
jgi:putative oxidoreductase